MLNCNYHQLNFLIVVLVSILFAPILTIRDTKFFQQELNSGLILFNRNLTLSSSEEQSSILVYNTHTDEEIPLTVATNILAYSWSHDGTRILGGYINSIGLTSLMIFDVNEKNRLQLTDSTQIITSEAQWTPTDEKILFWGSPLQANQSERYWAIFDIPSHGGALRRLTPEFFGLAKGGLGLAISPNGSQIAFAWQGKLFTMPAEGGQIFSLPVPLNVGATLVWSPDGTQIAALASRTDSQNTSDGIYLIKPDSNEIQLLVASTPMMLPSTPSWSLDGSQLLFRAWERNNSGNISLGIVTIGTGMINIYEVGYGVFSSLTTIHKAIWSADGTQIVLSAGTQKPYTQHLYLVDKELTHIKQLTFGKHRDTVVQWQP